MRRGVLQATRGVLWLAMVHHAGLLVDELVQGAAQRDIEFLMAAAHREQRQVPGQRRPDQRQGAGIALWVVRHGQRLGGRVVPRLDIRDAARQEQAVDQVEYVQGRGDWLEVLAGGGRSRQQDRHRAGTVRHRIDVLLADRMERVRPDLLDVGHDPDDGPPAPQLTHDPSPGGTNP